MDLICISTYNSNNYFFAFFVIARSGSGPRAGGEAISLYCNGIAPPLRSFLCFVSNILLPLFLSFCGSEQQNSEINDFDAKIEEELIETACPSSCNDNNPCTRDGCEKGKCVHVIVGDGKPCNDGSLCTERDMCKKGLCTGTPEACDDFLSCTKDFCLAEKGCVHEISEDPSCSEPQPLSNVRIIPYLQNMTSDSVVIMWETAESCAGRISYDTDQNYSFDIIEDLPRMIHEIQLTNLEPSAKYYYRVFPCRDDNPLPEVYNFSLFPDKPSDFRFAVWGDNQSNFETAKQVCSCIAKSNPAFVVSVGDVVQNGEIYDQWKQQYFDPISAFSPYVPSFVAIGNHEKQSPWFYLYVSQPEPEDYFAFSYGNARFVALDTNTDYFEGSKQYEWLVSELSSDAYKNAEWHFVFLHQAPYTEQWGSGTYTGEFFVTLLLLPLLENADVDILFCGHTHDYERGYIPDGDGMYYVITGGGGGDLDTVFTMDWEYIDLHVSQHHYMTVDIDGNKAAVRAWLLDGNILDAFFVEH
jgi:predicted phosphodiesterase